MSAEIQAGGHPASPESSNDPLPTTLLSEIFDAILKFIGTAFSWLWVVIMAVILWSVVSRYAFAEGSVALEETGWYLSSAAWLVGLSFTMAVNAHVRVDVLHERFRPRTQAWIELLGILILLLPFLALGLMEALPYFYSSYQINETSQAPGGLPYRWAIKFFIPLSFAFLIFAAVSRLSRCTAYLFGFPRPRRRRG